MEVVDVQVKVTSMQGTYLYKRDQTTQVVKCTLWTKNICPHPTIIKKMRTLLEVESKMGTTIQMSMPNSQVRPQPPITNPNVCRSDNAERKRTIMPKRTFRPITTTNPPISQIAPKPISEVLPTVVRTGTPWPGTGEMSGNLFKERNWLLPEGYLAMKNKKSDINMSSPKEEPEKEEKC